jgi:hypothetical protein
MSTEEQTRKMQEELTESLLRSREREEAVAQHLRSQRDDLTSKIRFGLVALNGASVVAVLTLYGSLKNDLAGLGITSGAVMWAVGFFVVGVVCAGLCLSSHQNQLVIAAGQAEARAITCGTAVDLSAQNPIPKQLGEILEDLRKHSLPSASYSRAAIWLQQSAASLWLGGSLVLISAILKHSL